MTNPTKHNEQELTNKENKMDKIELNGKTYVEESTIQYEQPKGEVLEIGKSYFIRTFSFHYVGNLKRITDTNLVLSNASWVADSGRFNEALSKGTLSEVECYMDDVILFKNALLDITKWEHDLPKESR